MKNFKTLNNLRLTQVAFKKKTKVKKYEYIVQFLAANVKFAYLIWKGKEKL